MPDQNDPGVQTATDKQVAKPSLVGNPPTPEAATTTNSPPNDNQSTPPPLEPSPLITTAAPEGGGKSKNKKVFATILGITLLLAAVGTGVFLVSQQQEIRIGAWDCRTYIFEVNQSGVVSAINGSTRNEPSQKANVSINGQFIAACDVPALTAGDAAQICTVPIPSTGNFSWEVVGTIDCEDSGSYLATPTPTPSVIPTSTPTPTDGPTPTASPSPTLSPTPTVTPTPPPIGAACLDVKAYDTNWVSLSNSDLSNLKPGDTIRFAVAGTTTSGSFDMARFTINGTLRPEVIAQKPASDEFYDEYTIPVGVTGFSVTAQVHHTSLGWF